MADVLTLIAGVPGTILGGYFADKFRRFGRGGRMLFGALAALIAVPFWLLFIFSGNLLLLLIANLVLLALSLVWLGPAAADVHDIAGPQLRGLGIGVYFFAVIIAYGIGSLIIGQLNDWLGAHRPAQHALLDVALSARLSRCGPQPLARLSRRKPRKQFATDLHGLTQIVF